MCLQVIVSLIYTSNVGHRGCMESVQQDTNMKCGLLESLLLGHVRFGQGQKAPLKLSQQLRQEGAQADSANFAGVLNACALL